MKFFDSVFNAFLSREQRERVNQSRWDKSVAQAARELGLDNGAISKTPVHPPTPPSTPQLPELNTNVPTSFPMTPSLSSSSTNSSSSGLNSPTRSRPSTSYSTSPRPEFRRHLSIQRKPISYDALITNTKPPNVRRASQDAAPTTHQLLYPLPPLGPMEGIGKYRRSVDVTETEYLDTLQRNTIAALQPFILQDDRVSRFRRDTTTPPRAYSVSPPMEQRLAMQSEMVNRLAGELEAAIQAQPIIEEFEDLPSPLEVAVRNNSRPVRVASRRRGATGGYKAKARREPDMSASMETLVSGEE
ncbi:hypothetical protein BDD12DRAFT_423564 [Trichophaea hybrida]|nr:hypothetical protein BDD12DRAFT_423564 [Trichophaea hybrida]